MWSEYLPSTSKDVLQGRTTKVRQVVRKPGTPSANDNLSRPPPKWCHHTWKWHQTASDITVMPEHFLVYSEISPIVFNETSRKLWIAAYVPLSKMVTYRTRHPAFYNPLEMKWQLPERGPNSHFENNYPHLADWDNRARWGSNCFWVHL